MTSDRDRLLRKRIVELGNSGDAAAVAELFELAQSTSFHICRLAVSGLGKLAAVADSRQVVPLLVWCLKNPHAQVRQYTIKALSAYGGQAESSLHDLVDIADNQSEKDYNRAEARKAITIIQQAVMVKEAQMERCCQKCGARVDSGEFARSQKAFQRSYCDHCFDEVYLSRRNWDTKVELNKNIRAGDGTFVQSKGEKAIAEWLSNHRLRYRYDERFRIIDGYAVRPDFYLPEFDLYIEYWGMDTIDYKIGMLKKKKLYQQTGKKLVSLYPDDIPELDYRVRCKLSRYMRLERVRHGDGVRIKCGLKLRSVRQSDQWRRLKLRCALFVIRKKAAEEISAACKLWR